MQMVRSLETKTSSMYTILAMARPAFWRQILSSISAEVNVNEASVVGQLNF
jgi:hypothetical protein